MGKRKLGRLLLFVSLFALSLLISSPALTQEAPAPPADASALPPKVSLSPPAEEASPIDAPTPPNEGSAPPTEAPAPPDEGSTPPTETPAPPAESPEPCIGSGCGSPYPPDSPPKDPPLEEGDPKVKPAHGVAERAVDDSLKAFHALNEDHNEAAFTASRVLSESREHKVFDADNGLVSTIRSAPIASKADTAEDGATKNTKPEEKNSRANASSSEGYSPATEGDGAEENASTEESASMEEGAEMADTDKPPSSSAVAKAVVSKPKKDGRKVNDATADGGEADDAPLAAFPQLFASVPSEAGGDPAGRSSMKNPWANEGSRSSLALVGAGTFLLVAGGSLLLRKITR